VLKALYVAASDSVELSTASKTGKTVESDSVVLRSAAASSETFEPSVADPDVHDLGASSAPYISSGLADAVGITETDTTGYTGDTGATAAAETALLHTKESETLDLAATGDTHADTGLEVVASDAATGDTGESAATAASDPSSDTTASADVAPPTATVDSAVLAAVSAPTAPSPSVSSVPMSVVVSPPLVDSDSESQSEMADSRTNNQLSPHTFRGLTTENAKDWIRQFDNYCT